MSRSWRPEMELAVHLAWAAGRRTLRHYQTGVIAEFKDDESPVTMADREAEIFIREGLQAAYPEDGIVGEEFEPTESGSGRTWYVDPIDGTKSFLSGVPLFGVLVGLAGPDDTSLAGAVYLPALDEMVCAARGEGCYWNGRRARVSTVTRLADARSATPRPAALASAAAGTPGRPSPPGSAWKGDGVTATDHVWWLRGGPMRCWTRSSVPGTADLFRL